MTLRSLFVVATVAGALAGPACRSDTREARPWNPVAASSSSANGIAYVFDGRSDLTFKPERSAVGGASAVYAPTLLTPVVSADGRSVFLQWRKSRLGADPLAWVIDYTLPSGATGSVQLPPGTTSLTAALPFAGLYKLTVTAYDGVTVGAVSEGRTFSANFGATVPGAVVGLTGSAVGTTLTLRWTAPVDSDSSTTFVVVFQGAVYPVGTNTSASSTVPAGRHSIEVFARNPAGDGPRISTEVSVVGPATLGNYSGPFTGTGPFVTATGTCNVTDSGTATITLSVDSTGIGTASPRGALAGTLNLAGTEKTSADKPGTVCYFSSVFQTANVALTMVVNGTTIEGGAQASTSIYWFVGRINDGSITGTLSVTEPGNPGVVDMPIVLTKS